MGGEWRTLTVQQLVDEGALERPIDGNHGEIHPKTSDFVERGIPFIMASDLVGGRVDTAHCAFISEEQAKSLRKGFALPGDVLISHKATMGRTAIVDRLDVPFLVLTPQVTYYRVKDQSRLASRYLKLYFDSHNFQTLFESWGQKGSTRAYLGITAQLDLPIVVPPPDEQRAIAHILGTLDDKIELNRRMNETLEAIARALFNSWFMDFDPVRAKAEGRDPGLPKPIVNLFPDSFEDSELGEIPTGWKVGKLGDVLAQRVERCIASSETAARPYVPIDCISPRSLFLTESKPGEEAQSSLTKFYKGDLLFGAMRPYFHKVCIAPFDGTTRTTAFVLTPKAKEDFTFATLLLHHPYTIDYATRHSTGSTIPYAVWGGSLEEMPVIVPPSAVRIAFNMTVRPILDRIPVPHFQSKTLAALRDSLLPKLISGELRVGDATRFLGDDG